MNRRFFLRSAGGLALAAPFLPSVWQRWARGQAAAPTPPRRTIIFHTPCGCVTNRWFPKVEDGPLDAAALAGTTLEVLTPHVRKLLVPRGLRALNGYGTAQTLDPHDQSMGSKLTCALLDTSNRRYATAASFDHLMAGQINPMGRPPIALGIGTGSYTNVKEVLSYVRPLTPHTPARTARAFYDGFGATVDAHAGELEYVRRRRLSIIDVVRDDLDRYRRVDMSMADKQRVTVWLDLLRESERGLTAMACNASAVGLDTTTLDTASDAARAVQYTLGAETMFKLMALSLLCDTNRVFVMNFSGFVVFDWDGIHHTHDHDGIAHRTGDFTVGGKCLPDAIPMLLQIDGWYADKFAKLIGLLDSIAEGQGSVLDNTAAVWLQEFSDGAAFNLNNMPIVIAGSAGGYFKQGCAVNLEGQPGQPGQPIGPGRSEDRCGPGDDGRVLKNSGSTGGNVPINKLYVTLLNAVGCQAPGGGPVTTFGALDGLTADLGITNPGELTALKA